MKAKITYLGFLKIERAETFKDMVCPYTGEGLYCGDWCPLFGEPRKIQYGNGDAFALNLCKNTLYLTELTDERNRNE